MDKSSFEAHAIWANASQLDTLLGQAEDREDPAAGAAIDSLRYIVAAIKSHSEPSDTAPYSSAALTSSNNLLQSMTQETSNYVSNGNVGHLNNAEASADQLLSSLGAWPTSILKGGAAAQANKIFMEYRGAAEQALAAMRDANKQLREDVASQKTDADQALAALRTEIAALTAKITQDEARLDAALTTTNDAFTAKQTEREAKFKDFLNQQGEGLEQLADKHLTSLKGLASEGQKTYAVLDGLRVGTEKVAGLASADILAGKFNEYSKQQWKWGVGANILGFLALASGLAVIGFALHSVGVNEKISWQYTTLKLGVTITIVGASAVAFRLGSTFLSRSGTSKRMELELRAIGPFFADIEDPEALKEAKRAFVERSFGRGWGDTPSDNQLSSSDTSTLLRQLVEIVKTVTSRG